MDGDGELQHGDDVSTFMPCASESGERHNGSSTNNDNNGCYDADQSSSGGRHTNVSSTTSGQGEEGGGGGTSVGDDDDDDDDEKDDEEESASQVQLRQIEDYESDDDSDEMKMHIDIPGEDDEDDQDSLDGAPSSSAGVPAVKERPKTEKRVPIKSQRMRDYQEMKESVKQSSRPRSCPYCGRVYHSGPGYRYHINSHKKVEESFTCGTCHKHFKSSNGLKYHLKRKRCSGIEGTLSESTAGSSVVTTSTCASSLLATTTTAVSTPTQGSDANRLMELAQIATGPQSPLLQSPGLDSRLGASGPFFDYSETSAAIALSMMRNNDEACSSNQPHCTSVQVHSYLQQPCHRIQQPQPPAQESKPKRPMNGFFLYAQENRGKLKKKYPHLNNRMISAKLAEEWRRFPVEERQRWKDDARVKAELKVKEHPDCWKRKK